MSIIERLKQDLQERETNGLYRRRRIMQTPQGVKVTIADCEFLNFCSNDYLGLANHPEVIKSFQQAASHYGVGSGSAHLINGHSQLHHQLEEALAGFVNRPRALLFSTGYMANLGVISALLGRGDTVFEDRLNHASLIDAGILSRAKLQRYAHNDMQALEAALRSSSINSSIKEKLIVTDGVFSMDGDVAPVTELAGLAQQYDALLMVDDAHGIGVLGKTGAGLLEQENLDATQVPVLMGTLGKALGTFGAFVAGDEVLIESLINNARSYVYTTAMPAAIAAATLTSLQLLQTESWRREKLQANIQQFKKGAAQLALPLMASDTAIQPLLTGDAHQALALSQQLSAAGYLISAIRPPTVPEGTARLRITLSAEHTEQHINSLLEILASLFNRVNEND
ncbi:MAG: 8-amino-7-oxononanoate synthase [Gammaproteobacteria bacterium]|nr:8-amino-7-oxononanoate synthase [Gammaproteobacteria bacterium]